MTTTKKGRKLKDKFTVADAIQADFKISDFIANTKEAPIDLNWELIIKLCNSMIVEGEPITKQSEVSEAMQIFQAVMSRAFL